MSVPMVRAALRGALGRAEGRRCVNSTRPNRGDPDRPVERAPGRSNGALDTGVIAGTVQLPRYLRPE